MAVAKWMMLVQREVWEHGSLLKIPLVLLALVVLANAAFAGGGGWLQVFPVELSAQLVGGTLRSLSTLMYVIFWLLAVFYLVDSLHAERQDNSILFWRSLPVSDLLTVFSKLFIGVVLIPLALWLTIVVAQALSVLLQIFLGGLAPAISIAELFSYWLALAVSVARATLWALPVFAWFLFCSSWTRRTPFLAALAIPAGLILLARLLGLELGLWRMIGERLPLSSNIFAVFSSGGFGGVAGLDGQLSRPSLFADPALWIGLLVASVLFAAAVWVRRWRDDG